MNISLTSDQIYASVYQYLNHLFGWGKDAVRRAYQDNAPLPFYPFVFITVLRSRRHATNEHSYSPQTDSAEVNTNSVLPVQLDFYGSDALDRAATVNNLFRDDYSVSLFSQTGLVPLYTDEAFLTGGEDGNKNFKIRCVTTLYFNASPGVTLPQDFFDRAELIVKNTEVLS